MEEDRVTVELQGKKILLRDLLTQRTREKKLLFEESRLTVKNLSYVEKSGPSKKGNKPILSNISFALEPRELTLVLGGADSGKTVLFEVIGMKRKDGVTGEIMLNGKKPDPKTFHREYSYVVRADYHLELLTVEETLRFAALQLPPSFTEDDIKERIDVILQLLGLSHARKTIVGGALLRGISGGEKRRLSIAIEWMKGPKFLMMDEPTTGLDASTAYQVIRDVKIISSFGNPVMCALHQPSFELFSLFDKLIILNKGQVAYWSPIQLAQEYFLQLGFVCPEGYTAPEFLADVVECPQKFLPPPSPAAPPVTTDHLIEDWNFSELKKRMVASLDSGIFPSDIEKEPQGVYAKSWNTQFKELVWRTGIIMWRDKLRYVVREGLLYCQSPLKSSANEVFIAAIIGSFFLYLHDTVQGAANKMGLLFFALTHLSFTSLAMIPDLFSSRDVFYYQRSARYFSTSSYFASVIVTSLPMSIIESFLFGTIIYWMANLNPAPNRYFFFLFMLFALFLVSQAFGRLACAITPDPTTSSMIISATILFFLIFSSYLIPKPQLPDGWSWFVWVDFFFYPTQGLATNEFSDLHCTGREFAPPNGYSLLDVPFPEGYSGQQICPLGSGNDFLRVNGWWTGKESRWGNLGAVLGFGIGIFLLTYFALRFIVFPSKEGQVKYVKKKKKARHLPEVTTFPGLHHVSFLTWQNVQYTVDSKKLLSDQYGYVKPGMLLALMGPSGAGKSTLLDVLALRKTGGKIEGKVLLNGKPIEPAKFHRYIAYVEQFDVHFPHYTVREALEFAARTRLPSEITPSERNFLIEVCNSYSISDTAQKIVELLELQPIENALIGEGGAKGGINPAERKRLSIGVELCSNPQILFLDEPTSGLDAAGADQVMQAIQKVASIGTAVICTIHQPSQRIFLRMTHLLLLGKGGTMLFFGEIGHLASNMEEYLFNATGEHCPPNGNPADFVISVSGRPELQAFWKSSPQFQKLQHELESEFAPLPEGVAPVFKKAYPVSWGVQYWWLLKRFAYSYLRNTMNLVISLARSSIIGFVVGTAFYQIPDTSAGTNIRTSVIFVSTMYSIFVAFASVIPLIITRPLFYKEKAEGMYHTSAYTLAKFTSDIPQILIETVIFSSLVYFIAGLRYAADRFFFFLATLLALSMTSSALGQMVAAYSPSLEVAGLVFGTISTTFIISSGFLLPKRQIRDYWIWAYWIDYLQYGLQAMVVNEVEGRHFGCPHGEGAIPVPIPLASGEVALQPYCRFETGGDIMNYLDLHKGLMWGGFFIIWGFYILFLIGTMIGLRFVSFQKR